MHESGHQRSECPELSETKQMWQCTASHQSYMRSLGDWCGSSMWHRTGGSQQCSSHANSYDWTQPHKINTIRSITPGNLFGLAWMKSRGMHACEFASS